MKILIFNWRDIKNPASGGAEVLTHENAKRWVKAGHKVTLFCRAFTKGLKKEIIDGIEIVRSGNKCTVYWHDFRYYKKYFEVVVDKINTISFLFHFMLRRKL